MARSISFLATLGGVLAAALPAAAGGSLEARYEVSYTGVTLGEGVLVVEVTDAGYSAAGSAAVAGLLKVVTPAKGTAAARGQLVDGKVMPVSYSASSESKKKAEEVRLSGAAGVVHDRVVLPGRKQEKDRVPITDEHRVGVVDPMSAALMPVAGDGELSGTDACDRTLPIYDGHYRYDLIMRYERTEPAKQVKGFSGPLAVCRVGYRPVAGHRADRKQVKELSANKEIFAWLAPIADTRVLVPIRVTIGTAIGTFVVQATRFSSAPKAAAASSSAR